LGKVKIVRSYITGFGFLTLENKLYILGNFGLTTYDEPFQVSSNNVNSFDINDAGIYFADSYGELYFISFQKESAKSERVSISEKIVHVQCGMDFTIAVNNERSLYGKGDNSQRQLSNQNQSSYANFHPL
jgi:alpha-tubulin suppressor-like RCC1 family protein